MSLQSFGFFGFLLVVAVVYLHLPQRRQSVFLLGASWVFYALAMPAMLPVTIAVAVFTYLCGCGLAWRMLPEEFEQWQNRLDPARYDQAAAVEQ